MQRPAAQWPETQITPTPSYIPSPTIEDFILSCRNGPRIELRVLELCGPRGEGKTTGCLNACLALGERIQQEEPSLLPIETAVVRDTMVNLSRTTIRSIRGLEKLGLPMTWKDQEREAFIGHPAHPLVHLNFFGLDRPGDVDKLQGFEAGILWPEEVAAAADISAGIPAEVFGMGVTSLRQKGVPKRVLLPYNPPDEDAWVLHIEEILADFEIASLKTKRWMIPPGEKERHFWNLAQRSSNERDAQAWETAAEEFAAYRRWCEAALAAIGRHDLAKRLIGGEIGEVKIGEPVVPNFVRAMHVVEALEPVGHGVIVRGFDGGGSPSTVICQQLGEDGRAGLNILASHTSMNTTLEAHLRDWVIPTMSKRGLMPSQPIAPGAYAMGAPRRRLYTFRDIADPSMTWEGGTVKSENTAGLVIQQMLNTSLEPGPVEWDARRQALLSAFGRAGEGDRSRFIQIDKRHNPTLISALAGRFRYPRDMASGRITMTIEAAKRASGPQWSGVPDALAYILSVLYPAHEWVRQALRRPVPRAPRPKSWIGV